MRATFNINYYCRKSKVNRKGEAPIELSIIINGRRQNMNLPRKYRPELFERDMKRPNSELRAYIAETDRMIMRVQTEMMENDIPLTAGSLREYIKSGGVKPYDMDMLFDDFINDITPRVSSRTVRKYQIVINLWKNCSPNMTDLKTATLLDGQRFYRFLQDRYEQSTVSGMATKMKSIFRYAVDGGFLKMNPMANIRISKGEKDVEFLSEEEIESIRKAGMPSPCYERVRDMFLFQAGTGLAYADIAALRKDDVKEENGTYYITKRREKTGVEYTTVLLPFAVDIWRRYGGSLPVISNQRYNIYLKIVQAAAGLKKSLHSHLARDSFACYALNRGIRIEIVSKALGHTNLRQTQHYAKLMKSTIVNELRMII